ncbi:MAG: AAA family ATPase [Neisseriaceae bacterium]|nr:AAA family ATPase [Neisseriaceae bacterium]
MSTIVNQIVITGGPGAGKSTLLTALAEAGYAVSAEVGRAVIQAQVASSGTALPWLNPLAFAEAMLAGEQKRHAQLPQGPEPVFLDRGWLDVIGYLNLEGLPPSPEMLVIGAALPRYRQVFILPPWRQIFTQDAERKQDFDVAVRTHKAMRHIYVEHGYAPIDVPIGTVAERMAFVLANRV